MRDAFDLVVVGGGVNGAGIARDAAGRGLSVLLAEKGDLAEGTSSRSGKLVHGGLRYLEYYEFRLVREALIEREVLLAAAPHIIWPMRFVLPHSPQDRPAWLVRLGLLLYDHLGGRKVLPGTRTLDLTAAPEGRPLKSGFRRGYEYSDCWVDDARLVVLNALDAAARGAEVLTRTEVVSASRADRLWHVTLRNARTGAQREVAAGALVNAAGPWVREVIARAGRNSPRGVRLVKGSHIVTRKLWDGPQAYLIQNTDRRVIFVNPYEGDLALIGTTDVPWEDAPEDAAASEDEIAYLLAAVNRYFAPGLTRADVREHFSGVRPLYDDGAGNPSAVTRDYVLDLDAEGGAPLLNVFGGKITTFRKLAEHALRKLGPHFPRMDGDWTARAPLPGGDVPGGDVPALAAALRAGRPGLDQPLADHLARLYGTRAARILAAGDLGRRFGPMLTEAEARYLMAEEWAETADDILLRRTKHSLHMTAAEIADFTAWLSEARP